MRFIVALTLGLLCSVSMAQVPTLAPPLAGQSSIVESLPTPVVAESTPVAPQAAATTKVAEVKTVKPVIVAISPVGYLLKPRYTTVVSVRPVVVATVVQRRPEQLRYLLIRCH